MPLTRSAKKKAPALRRQRKVKDFAVKLSRGEYHVIVEPFEALHTNGKCLVLQGDAQARQTENYMDSSVHEAVHAAEPSLTEAQVVRIAADVSTVLWKMGYRLPK